MYQEELELKEKLDLHIIAYLDNSAMHAQRK